MTEEKIEGKKAYLFEQREVDYTPLSTTAREACGGCRWFSDHNEPSVDGVYNSGSRCHLVTSYPLPIRATGWCDQFTAIPESESTYIEVLEDLVEVMESKEQKANPTLKERLLMLLGIKARDEPVLESGFKALGNGKWIAIWSNNFEDLDGEYFSAKATDEYIARLDAKEIPFPELWFWHIPYPFGRAKAIARIAADERPNAPSFNIAVGEFYETPHAVALEKATLKSKREYKMSHGYFYPENALIEGVYHYYDTFELSVLPNYAAANPFTLFGDEQMPISPNKIKELETALGGDKALLADVVALVERKGKEVAATGQGYKEMAIPAVDSEARAKLDTLEKSIAELSENVKAALKKPADDEEEEDGKKKKPDFGAMKKEYDDKVDVLTKSVNELSAQVKGFLDLTPRRATKDQATLVPADDAALIELQKGATGEKSNEDKIFAGAFGGILPGFGGK